MKRFSIIFLLLLLASSLFVVSCASKTTPSTSTVPSITTTKSPVISSPMSISPTTSAAAQPQYGGTLKIIYIGNLGNLGSPSEGSQVFYPMTAGPAIQFLNVVDRDWNPMITPSTLASSFDISPDGKTITYHLRKGITFQDGTDFNADAVKYNLANNKIGGVPPATLANVASYEVIDPYTLKITLKNYDPYFLSNIGRGNPGMMASPAALSINSTAENAPKDHMVGTGAFKFDSWQRDTYVRYVKAANYWEPGKPYLDAVEIRQMVDATTAVMAFKSGEAHLISGISPQQASDLKAAGYQIIVSNTISPVSCIVPNATDPNSPFYNKSVREALEYAIDKKTITSSLGYGFFETATQFASTSDSRYVTGLPSRDYDPDKAKQLLADAGFANGFKTTIHAANIVDKDYLVALVSYLKKVNIDATLDMVDYMRFITMYNGGWDGIMVNPNMSGNLFGLNMYFGPPKYGPYTYANVYRPADWIDKLNKALTESDSVKRATMEKDLIAEVSNEAMAIPINITAFLAAQTSNVHSLDWGGYSNYQFQAQNAWLSSK
jgi:peptide/nickel transport system substrate-binding protein